MTRKKRQFTVEGVCCSTEEQVLRKSLDASIGRDQYAFSLATGELMVDGDVEERRVLAKVRQAGFDAHAKEAPPVHRIFWSRHETAISAGSAAAMTIVGLLLENRGQSSVAHAVLLLAVVIGGWRIALKAGHALAVRALDMNVLMTAAVIGALCIGKWGEGASVIVLFSVSLLLESYSASRSRRAIRSLMTLSPEEVTLSRDGREVRVSAATVQPGDIMVIRPGERLLLDGVVVNGISEINEAPMTGESAPVTKTSGLPVYAGSINGRGTLSVKITRRFEDTTMARILHHIEEAQHQRAPIQTATERFAAVYTPAVLAGALLVAVVPPLVFHEPFVDWLYRSLVLMVIACPCALVISTPVSIVSALTNAARRGILIKGGRHLETLADVRAVAFDKTGTLTEGRPALDEIVMINSYPRPETLRMIAAIEHRSEHHLAAAMVEAAVRDSLEYASVAIEEFEALPGWGVRAVIDGKTYFLGNSLLAHEHGFLTPEIEQVLERLGEEGKTTVIFGRAREPICVLALNDTSRPSGRTAIAALASLGIRHTEMLSGDQERAARHIARETGIGEYRAGLFPEQKVAAVEDLKRRYGTVAMVGDGINDAPALAASSVGIAMGVAGTDVALETADVVLMSDELSKLPHLFGLSHKAIAVIRQNIALAVVVKLVFFGLSLAGVATLWMALLADDGAALAVILNGLRLLSFGENR